jgi:lipid II:glycine glycyltransferase (peptidoglycan interpeptide bridge formation enzyme)
MVQYHLSGLDDDYFDLNPIKLIIDEMRIQSTQQQFEFLNLGGGRGSKEDSLFTFKTSFSKHFKEFKIWKYVVNEKVYRTLVEKHLGTRSETEVSNDEFFPAYRLENEHQKFE